QASRQLVEIESKLADYENNKNTFVLNTTILKLCISEQKQELDGIKTQIADIEDTIAKEDNEVSGLIKNFGRIEKEIKMLENEYKKRLINLDYTNTKNRLEYLKELFDSNTLETANEVGQKRELEEAIKCINDELETNYQDIEKKHMEQDVLMYASELAIEDLN